jgi:hypothetical protein
MSEIIALEEDEEKKCVICGFERGLRRCDMCGGIYCQDHLDKEQSSDQTDEHFCLDCSGWAW